MTYRATFLRHAESECNADSNGTGTYEHLRDCDITEHGKWQCTSIFGTYDIAFVSPLQRTQRTLELSRIECPIKIIDAAVREWPCCICDLLASDANPLYETRDALLDRARQFLQRITSFSNETDKSRILVVSHAGFINACANVMTGMNLERGLDNAESVVLPLIKTSMSTPIRMRTKAATSLLELQQQHLARNNDLAKSAEGTFAAGAFAEGTCGGGDNDDSDDEFTSLR